MKLKVKFFGGDEFEKEFKSLILNSNSMIVDGALLYIKGMDGVVELEINE